MKKAKIPVVLISMPFAPLVTPSLGLGLLKAAMDRAHIPSKQFYFSIRYATLIGERLYSTISQEIHPHDLAGEWIFSNSLFNHQSDTDVDRYIKAILKGEGYGRTNTCNYLASPSEDV